MNNILEEKEKINKIYNIFKKNKSVSTDSREIKKGDIFFALSGENFNGNIFAKNALEKEASLVIIDDEEIFNKLKKDFKNKIILTNNTLKTLQDLAKKYREDLKIPFLGITGSNGKTTTKELIRDVLLKKYKVRATVGNFNNHIGVPLTILSIEPTDNFAIIEMGANHICEIKTLAEIAKPDFGIITNIGLAHIGEFGNFKNIVKTKKELFDEVLKKNGKIFINNKDETLKNISQNFPKENIIKYFDSEIINSENFIKLKIENNIIKTNLIGEYNKNNIQAAYTVGKFFNIPEQKIISAFSQYKPTNNRSQLEKSSKNNNIIWDCYNANPSSMNLALKSFFELHKDNNYFILGEMGELGKYSEEEHFKIIEILKNKKDKKFLLGKEFEKVKNFVKNDKNFIFLKNLEELKKELKKENIKNKNILVKGSNSTKLFDLQNKKLI